MEDGMTISKACALSETELLRLARYFYGDRAWDIAFALSTAARYANDPFKIADALIVAMHEGGKRVERDGKMFLSFRDETPSQADQRFCRWKAFEVYLIGQFMKLNDLVLTRASESTVLKQVFAVKPQWNRHYLSPQDVAHGAHGGGNGAHFDHDFYFRRRTSADYVLATHPYDVDDGCRQEWREIAVRTGATVQFPDDFPSWWYPKWTTLIICYREQQALQQSA
jgi:hypothetical protein